MSINYNYVFTRRSEPPLSVKDGCILFDYSKTFHFPKTEEEGRGVTVSIIYLLLDTGYSYTHSEAGQGPAIHKVASPVLYITR